MSTLAEIVLAVAILAVAGLYFWFGVEWQRFRAARRRARR